MTNQYRNPKERNTGNDSAVLGLVALVILASDLNRAPAAQFCNLLDRIGWAAFEVLRLALSLSHWQIAPYVSDGFRLLQPLLHVAPCFWCLLRFVAGQA
jgi:hypothetical protein